MADIPDEAIIWGVENVMDGDGEFHNPQACTQVPASFGNLLNHVDAQFSGELGKHGVFKSAQI